MNIDFRVKEVGAEVYEVTLRIESLKGLGRFLEFMQSQMPRHRTIDDPPLTSGERQPER